MTPRELLLEGYAAALRAVEGRGAVRAYLEAHPGPRPDHLVAIGKAAASMARGALEVLGPGLRRGLLITKYGHLDPGLRDARFVLCEAGHPLPDAGSLMAGEALVAFLEAAPADARFLFLISGGASALAERLPAGETAETLAEVNRWLLASGWPIDRINRVRRALSCLKGGRLAHHLHGRPTLNLLLSDVPGDDPAVIGSGPLVAGADGGLPAGTPAWIARLAAAAPPPPAVDEPMFGCVTTALVATRAMAAEAVVEAAAAHGLALHRQEAFLDGEAEAAGERIADVLRAGPPGLYLWSGETTVTLPPEPGRGGRCQTLALAAARRLAGAEGIWLLAAGTDGSDGPTDDAGALVDGGTVARGEAEGLEAARALAAADAGTFLEASGDLIQTGPTGTNVMDLVLGLKMGRGEA